jgi:hypothetical protein
MAQSGGGNLEEKKQQQKQQTARGSSGGASRAASSGLRREEASAAEQKNQRSKLQKHACPRDRMRSRSFICGQFFVSSDRRSERASSALLCPGCNLLLGTYGGIRTDEVHRLVGT